MNDYSYEIGQHIKAALQLGGICHDQRQIGIAGGDVVPGDDFFVRAGGERIAARQVGHDHFLRRDLSRWNYFVRFLVMLYCLEIYDILFFDWVLLCHSNFFPHFYPELKGVVGPHMFGYNKKQHALHFVVYIPACAAAAWLCTRLF